jgi:hypothetical protein
MNLFFLKNVGYHTKNYHLYMAGRDIPEQDEPTGGLGSIFSSGFGRPEFTGRANFIGGRFQGFP